MFIIYLDCLMVNWILLNKTIRANIYCYLKPLGYTFQERCFQASLSLSVMFNSRHCKQRWQSYNANKRAWNPKWDWRSPIGWERNADVRMRRLKRNKGKCGGMILCDGGHGWINNLLNSALDLGAELPSSISQFLLLSFTYPSMTICIMMSSFLFCI